MVLVHLIVALLSGLAGVAFGALLGVPVLHIGALYTLCGAMGMLMSVSAVIAIADASDSPRRPAQDG
ncbi:hypothetical protein ROE7235_00443 [Roseibaca ekhonensis]|uniref:Uncharacterized protein n=1 Tax=Roseinatronobacter ekhonensis TaxID=254356 RepID=A0A3B0MHW1_9RHOB|nr:hypothetical protein ROE7235_00443 [Roseibaca ekhonensis]